jgi:hypothetical protein
MRTRFVSLLGLVTLGSIVGIGLDAEAGTWNISVKETIPAGQELNVRIDFTKDGTIIASKVKQVANGTNKPITTTVTATAPPGTNDRDYDSAVSPLGVTIASSLPSGQGINDYGDFLASHGFVGPVTLDSPLTLGAANTSIFADILNVQSFSAVANASNFPLGSTLATNSSGQVSGLPGIEFFTDSSFTTPYANGQMTVMGIISESAVPEPPSMILTAIGVLVLAGSAYVNRRPVTA